MPHRSPKSMHILAIDQGTTGTKALLVDTQLRVLAEAHVPFKQHFPKPGWVEHDVNEIWASVLKAIKKLGTLKSLHKVGAIGITNQRETVCFWNRKTGEALSRAIVWQDRRTAEFCYTTKAQNPGLEDKIRRSTGLLLDPYFSMTKVQWALEHVPAVRKASRSGQLAVGTIDSFLLHRLSGGKVHGTEPSNACRTLAFDLEKIQWDFELSQIFKVPVDVWPEVRPSFGEFAKTERVPGLRDGTPITGVLGDQQAALLGQACIEEGEAKCTFGTGAFLLMNTGGQPIFSKHRLLTTIAWADETHGVTYALEGSAFVAGALVQWIRDGLKWIKKSSDIEKLARSVKSSEGVTIVPSLTGLGAPHWVPEARGLICGLTRGTTSAHMARAAIEGICFQNADLLAAMQRDLAEASNGGKRPKMPQLKVDGGAVRDDLMMQFQADILGVQLSRPRVTESTALGAAFAAGLGVGIWKDVHSISKVWREDRRFKPQMNESERRERLAVWDLAVRRASLK